MCVGRVVGDAADAIAALFDVALSSRLLYPFERGQVHTSTHTHTHTYIHASMLSLSMTCTAVEHAGAPC